MTSGENLHFESLRIGQVELLFNYTLNHKTKTTKDESIKLCKTAEDVCEHTHKKFRVINQSSC